MGIRSKLTSFLSLIWSNLFGDVRRSTNKRTLEKGTNVEELALDGEVAISLLKRIEEEIPTTLSCETFEVSVDAEIDYVDKSGIYTRREITTDQIFEYEDGVLVIRAFCHRRKDYRTFVSKRIQHWKDSQSGKLVPVPDLSQYLRKIASADPQNIAREIYEHFIHEIYLAIDSLARFSGHSQNQKYSITGQRRTRILDWVWNQEESKVLSQILQASSELAYEELRVLISETEVTRSIRLSSVSVLRKASDARKQALIEFISQSLRGTPEHDSSIGVLKDELIHPSFPIKPIEINHINDNSSKVTAKDFADAKKKAEPAQKKYQKAQKSKTRSKAYRYYERNDPVRICALREAQSELAIKQRDGDLVFDREDFEQKIRAKLIRLMSEEDMEDQDEMFLRRLGSGISLAYLTFGLKKKNRGWYQGPNGRCVIDLRNASPS